MVISGADAVIRRSFLLIVSESTGTRFGGELLKLQSQNSAVCQFLKRSGYRGTTWMSKGNSPDVSVSFRPDIPSDHLLQDA